MLTFLMIGPVKRRARICCSVAGDPADKHHIAVITKHAVDRSGTKIPTTPIAATSQPKCASNRFLSCCSPFR